MERWCIALKAKTFLKNNFRLVLFAALVIGVIVYLFIATSSNDSTAAKPPVNNGNPNEAMTVESQDETATTEESGEEIVEEEPVENFVTEDVKVEHRPSIVEGDPQQIEEHNKISENENYQLFLNEDNLSIIIRDKKSGAVMYSTVDNPEKSNEKWSSFVQSAVVVEYLVGTNIVYSQADMMSKDFNKTVDQTDEGFIAHLNFKELAISLDLHVSLNDEGLLVEIPEASIKEENDKYKIGNIYLYPFLGYSKMDEEEGYLLIPDGSGALISLKDHYGQYTQPYSEPVYGTNHGIDDPYVLSLKEGQVTTTEPNTVTAPIFGIVHSNKKMGFLGIVEGGDYNATIEAYPNGAILPYNWTTSKFTYRQFFNQSTSKDKGTMVVRQKRRNVFDAKVQYSFVSGEEASYVGLAKNYRQYLIEQQIIPPNEQIEQFDMKIDFLNADLKEGLIKDSTVAMTSFDEVDSILSKLQKEGIDSLNVVLKGWQKNGIYGGYAQDSYEAESKLGGNTDLNQLLETYKGKIPIYLYDDPLRFNPETQNSTWFNLVTKLNKRTLVEEVHGQRFDSFNYLNPNDSKKLLQNRLKSQSLTDYEGIAIDGISNHLFSYSVKGKEYGRDQTLESYQQMIQKAGESKQVLLQNPIQPYWQYANGLTEVPVYSSNYVFQDQSVPFFAIALKGLIPRYAPYTNFIANQQEYKLKLIEQGVSPSYLLTSENPSELNNTNSSGIYSSQFKNYEKEIVDLYKELEEVNESIGQTLIKDYEVDGDQVVVSYENGKVLLLNYSEESKNIQGQTVEGYSYKVVSQ